MPKKHNRKHRISRVDGKEASVVALLHNDEGDGGPEAGRKFHARLADAGQLLIQNLRHSTDHSSVIVL